MKKIFKYHCLEFSGYAVLLFLLVIGLGSQLLFSQPIYTASAPTIITYQGKLLQSSSAVTTTKSMGFLLHSALSGGSLLYTASGTLSSTSTVSVTPENGLFTVQLGATGTNALDSSIFQNNSAVFLEVWVNGQVMTPRKRITTAPFAFNAQYLMGYSATTTSSSTYIPLSDSNGNFTFSGTAQSSAVGGGLVYINPTTSTVNQTFFGVADNGTQRFKVDKEGDTWVNGTLTASGTTNLIGTTTAANLLDIQGRVGAPIHKGSIADGAGGALLGGAKYQAIAGNYAYVTANTDNALEVIDISNPASPVHKGSLANGVGGALLTGPKGISVSGNYAYIASYTDDALEIVDISDPANPAHKGKVTNGSGGAALDGPTGVTVSGNYAYVAVFDSNSLEIIDISNPARPVHKGKITNGGSVSLNNPTGVAVSGNYAYVATWDALEIVDISDPANPAHKGKITNGSGGAALLGATSVTIAGNYAYISTRTSNALEIVDISDPANPAHKGKITNGEADLISPYSVAIAGRYAYIAGSNGVGTVSLSVIDISSPASPTLKGALANGSGGAILNDAESIVLSGNYAYVTASSSLEIVDISGATISQAEIGTTKTTNLEVLGQAMFSQDVSVRGGLAIGNNGLLLSGNLGMSASTSTVNATNTLSFSHTALFQTSASTTAATAFVFDTANTLSASNLFSIRNNGTSRFVIDNNGNVGLNTTTLSYGFTIQGTSYFFGTSTFGGNVVFSSTSLSGLNNLTMSGLFNQTGTSTLATTTISNLTVSGETTLSTSTITVLTTTGNTTLATTTITSSTITTLNTLGQSYFGGTSTLANTFQLEGRVGTPVHKGSISNSPGVPLNSALHVSVSGDYAYVASFASSSITILDVSNPASPMYKGSIAASATVPLDGIYAVTISGNYAYVAANTTNSLAIVDISDSGNPTFIGSISHGSGGASLLGPSGVFVLGNYAYVITDTSNALEIIDISNPRNPIHKGAIASASLSFARSLYVAGNYAYVAALGNNSLTIIDVADPANPRIVKTLTNGSGGAKLVEPYSVFVSGNYAYVASYGSNALEIVDVSRPANATHKGSITTASGIPLGGIYSVFVSGNYAYVAASASNTLSIIDVTNPANPTFKASLSNGSGGALLNTPTSVFVSGNNAYVTAYGSNALEVIDVAGGIVTQANIGTTRTGNLQVMNYALFDQAVNVRGGLAVGNNGLLLSGDFGMSSPTSTINATNTLTFSHSALFKSSAGLTDNNLFIFDTTNNYSATVSSTYLLSVRNNGRKAFSVASNGDVAASGTLYATSATVGTPGAPGDLAESVDIAPDDAVEPGDVVVVDVDKPDTYRRNRGAYDARVAGVISTNPTIVVGNGRTNYTAIMAMVGRVPIKVSSENGSIQRGDLLVSASLPGYAMRYDQANDETAKLVGVVGIALDSFSSGTGKIMGLVRTGWVHNRNQALSGAEGATATPSSTMVTPMQLTVQQDTTGNLMFASNQTVDIRNYSLVNVAAISGLNKKWQIDGEGRLVTEVQTKRGTKSIYALQSQSTEYIFSGSDKLLAGEKKITFDEDTLDIIDVHQPLKISVTLTSPAVGIYISAKDEHGFIVKELGGGTSAATFDWVVIALRKGVSTQAEVPVAEVSQPAVTILTPTTTPTATSTPESTPEIVPAVIFVTSSVIHTPIIVTPVIEQPAVPVVEPTPPPEVVTTPVPAPTAIEAPVAPEVAPTLVPAVIQTPEISTTAQ